MHAGGIHLITDSGNGIDTTDFPRERVKNGETLLSTVSVKGNGTAQTTLGADDLRVARGEVARDDLADIKTKRITSDGDIVVDREATDIETEVRDFTYVQDEFLLTDKTREEATCELVAEAIDGTVVPTGLDIRGFAEAHPEAEPDQAWTRNEDEEPECLGAFGSLEDADDLAKRVEEGQDIQRGFKNLEWEGRLLRGTTTRSGYLAIYGPQEMSRMEFVRFIRDEVLPHASPTKFDG